MNLHLNLSRIAAAAFRRMCGNPTPLTVAAGYTDLANLAAVAPAGRQFCRTGQHTCVPAVTLTFDDGARRLHWCAKHAADADAYRANVVAPRLDPLVPGSRNLTDDNRTRYVHTSVSTDTAHAADNNGNGHATDLPDASPFRDVIIPDGTGVFTNDGAFGHVVGHGFVGREYGGPGRLVYGVRDGYRVTRTYTAANVRPAG